MEIIKTLLDAKAAELRKTESSLTKEQAFEKVYTDPANRHLVKAYKQEQRANQREAASHGRARAQLDAKAAELRQTESALTREQAFARVYTDPANRDIVMAFKDEIARLEAGRSSVPAPLLTARDVAEKPRVSKLSIPALAEALLVSDGMDYAGALRYVLNTKEGRALLRATENHTAYGGRPNNENTVRTERAARMDIQPPIPSLTAKIAQQIVEDGTTSLSEAQFTKLVKTRAQVGRLADETPEQAFAKYFSAPTEESRLVREAHRIARRTAAA